MDSVLGCLRVRDITDVPWALVRRVGLALDVFDNFALELTPLELATTLTTDDYGLYIACKRDAKPLAAAMLARGAQIKQGLDWACYYGAVEIAKLILAQIAPLTPAKIRSLTWDSQYFACRRGQTRVLRVLLEQGLHPEAGLLQYGLTKSMELVFVLHGVPIKNCHYSLTLADLLELYDAGLRRFGKYTTELWCYMAKDELRVHLPVPDLADLVFSHFDNQIQC